MSYNFIIILSFLISCFFLFSLKNTKKLISIILLSWLFYFSYCGQFLWVLVYVSLFSFVTSRLLVNTREVYSKIIFISGLFFTALPLIGFKYLKPLLFSGSHMDGAIYYLGINEFNSNQYLIPLGISFYSYQAISYIIDVYKKKINATDNILLYLAFLSYFPQLFIGPISRFATLSKELTKNEKYNTSLAMDGVFLLLIGLIKKIIISENLSPLFKSIFFYENSIELSWLTLIASPCFLFFDFSSYSDICRGLSKIFNIELTSNFDSPLTQKTISSFWSRWHISLYLWLRDYLFMPLLSISSKREMIYVWILFVFSFSGLWHGPEIKFILAGASAAFFIVCENIWSTYCRKKNYEFKGLTIKIILHLYTYVVMSFIILLYLSPDTSSYFIIIKNLFTSNSTFFGPINISQISPESKIALGLSILFIFLEYFRLELKELLRNIPLLMRWSLVSISIVLLLLFYKSNLKPFIYFFS